ncbi:unnamed protein product [Peronospora belbahrii]|uniref:Uncharacterized protein n=1 Tax=Peronospora belbahrii TaxID=622444 RepID=A0AAU9LDW8_9STRA|nr:unnamed protein product [Peronospora belbahrii]CAH0514406.1 unnamed protein product [Peronospora belbahrii]
MQMQQVRFDRAKQVPVPPENAAPLEISREMRQQLRVMRHHAFERYQENAQWTKELLEGSMSQDGVVVTHSHLLASVEELQMKLEARKNLVQDQERKLVQLEKAHEMTQRRFEDILTALKTAEDAAAINECEAKLSSEKRLLLPNKLRKMEIVRL